MILLMIYLIYLTSNIADKFVQLRDIRTYLHLFLPHLVDLITLSNEQHTFGLTR